MAAKTAVEKPTPVDQAFDFLESVMALPLPTVVACFGSDDFLRRTAISHLTTGSGIDPETIRSFDGETDQWRDVHGRHSTQRPFRFAMPKTLGDSA